MNKIFKPAYFLFVILNVVIAFILGMALGGILQDGKSNGFEGGAIIFNYGLITALIVLIISLLLVYRLNKKTIVNVNIAGLILLGMSIAFLANKSNDRNKPKDPIVVVEQPLISNKKNANLDIKKQQERTNRKLNNLIENRSIGLGIFKPNISKLMPLYFYGLKSNGQELDLLNPIDSVTFVKGKYNSVEIVTAPPWLVPAHLKLDYDILMFKTKEVAQNFYKIEVNKSTLQTSYVLRDSGVFEHWADFLLGVNSVELIEVLNQSLHVKPQDNAGKFLMKYSFLQPISIQDEWMKVKALDQNYNLKGEAWVKWREGGKMLIHYSIMS